MIQKKEIILFFCVLPFFVFASSQEKVLSSMAGGRPDWVKKNWGMFYWEEKDQKGIGFVVYATGNVLENAMMSVDMNVHTFVLQYCQELIEKEVDMIWKSEGFNEKEREKYLSLTISSKNIDVTGISKKAKFWERVMDEKTKRVYFKAYIQAFLSFEDFARIIDQIKQNTEITVKGIDLTPQKKQKILEKIEALKKISPQKIAYKGFKGN